MKTLSNKKIRILILNYEYPPLGGGAGVVSRYHAEGLSKKGYKTTVLTAWYKGEEEIYEKDNLKIIKLKSKRKYTYKSTPDEWISWIFTAKKFLSDYLQKYKFDYCFAHFALPSGEVAKFINKKFNIPFAIISHGQDIPWFFPKQMFKYHLITYFWIKQICNRADKLILLTDAMKKNADRFMKKSKHKNIIIPNGCQIDTFASDYSKKNKKFKILFIGRLVAQKDPFTFLKAIKFAKETINDNFEVKILGAGPLLSKMKNFVLKNKLTDIIEFKGWVNKEQMLKEYQSSHIQVISSKAEAMSIAALEALSTGLFVISTPVSGNTDIIEENINGSLFNFLDAETLSEKITAFYNEKFMKNYTVPQSFLDNFRNKYNWGNIVDELSKIIP